MAPRKHEVKDALWVVKPTDYVDSTKAPPGSLFDSPARLNIAWASTWDSLLEDGKRTDKHKADLAKRAAARVTQLRRSAGGVNGASEPS
jgi:hypothetical protein